MNNTPANHRLVEHSRNIHSLKVDISTGETFRVLLTSDVHFDSTHCRRDALVRHFNEAKAIGAPIIIAGDWFDAMQGKHDKRASKSEVDPRYVNKGAYFNALVDETVDFLMDYPVALLTLGNHETSVIKNSDFDLTAAVVQIMRSKGHGIHMGGYGGWLRFGFTQRRTVKFSHDMRYFHGSGGGAPMSHGTLDTRRMASIYPDADIVLCGHTHSSYVVPMAMERVTSAFKLQRGVQWHIRTPGYKDEHGDGYGGWSVERGHMVKPIGSVWLDFAARDSQPPQIQANTLVET